MREHSDTIILGKETALSCILAERLSFRYIM